MYGLTPFSSNEEVERVLTEKGIRLQPSVGGRPYAVDHHYDLYVLDSIDNLEVALKMLDQLDAEHRNGRCAKASEARRWLDLPFWQERPGRTRTALASCRRVCCGTHETYSFAVKK
ncbi:hypothetical protein Rctr85_084 [Virus Rctr85]|nr:hypothetical protein Rctr85_084 [Virus Rctr85]